MSPRLAAAVVLLVTFGLAGCVRSRPASHEVLRVGTSGDYPPFSLTLGDRTVGLDVAVATRFAGDTGRRLELVPFRWPDLRRDLSAGRFDLAMSGITMRPERSVGALFTRPMLTTGAVVVVRSPATITTAEQLDRQGVRIAMNEGGHLEWVARRLFPTATLTPIQGNALLPGVLEMGGVDAILVDDAEAGLVRARVSSSEQFGPLTLDHKAYLGRDANLVAELDAWLRARAADGWLSEVREQWLGETYARRQAAVGGDLDALVAFIDLRLRFMPAVAIAKERARLPIDDPVQERRVLAAAQAKAAERGLAPTAVDNLVRAQLGAARTVQRAVLALPAGRRPPIVPLDLEREARPALAVLSDVIVARAADVAADPAGLAGVTPSDIAESLDPTLTPETARLAIGEAVVGLGAAR